ncbi:MAG: nitroreductase family protein [Planctomycetota bacterium]
MSFIDFQNVGSEWTDEAIRANARAFFEAIRTRRSVREFSNRAVPKQVIADCIASAGRAPCGANQQAWHFVAVSDPAVKREIRLAAETEEREFYERRATQEWLDTLAPLGTDANKPFLEVAPWLIAIFSKTHGFDDFGEIVKHYYPTESIGIATGFLIAALHQSGLATLTHTPSPMQFLGNILGRPKHERCFLLLVVGHAADSAKVPDIEKKPLNEIATFLE